MVHSQVSITRNRFIGEQNPDNIGLALGVVFNGEVSADLRRNTFINTASVGGRASQDACPASNHSTHDMLVCRVKPCA